MRVDQPKGEEVPAESQRPEILNTLPEISFDQITKLAMSLLGVSIALISLVDREQQWFKSVQGVEWQQTSSDLAFCAFTIDQEVPLIVSDTTRDQRFSDNPLAIFEPRVRFYASAPLKRKDDGSAVGVLYILDTVPRKEFSTKDLDTLTQLADIVTELLERERSPSPAGKGGLDSKTLRRHTGGAGAVH